MDAFDYLFTKQERFLAWLKKEIEESEDSTQQKDDFMRGYVSGHSAALMEVLEYFTG